MTKFVDTIPYITDSVLNSGNRDSCAVDILNKVIDTYDIYHKGTWTSVNRPYTPFDLDSFFKVFTIRVHSVIVLVSVVVLNIPRLA